MSHADHKDTHPGPHPALRLTDADFMAEEIGAPARADWHWPGPRIEPKPAPEWPERPEADF
jgi:hypothetical protein